MESYIDKAKCEPLDLKHNTVKELFLEVLKLVLSLANIPTTAKKYKDLPVNNLFLFFINFVRKDLNCNLMEVKTPKMRKNFHIASEEKKALIIFKTLLI